MRKKMVAGNWKMFGTRSQVQTLLTGIKSGASHYPHIDMVVFPSYVHLSQAEEILKNSSIYLGAQNLYTGETGAFTGEISAPMLADSGCRYVLVGHSERRNIFQENLDLIAAKFNAALQFGLTPILCVGETLAQREKDETRSVIKRQLLSVIETTGIQVFDTAIIAYEPVWAIGTGLSATPLQAQEVHEFIRSELAELQVDVANRTRILYGGSVKADNAAGLFAMPDIDGGLVGGASLDAKSFLAICQAA